MRNTFDVSPALRKVRQETTSGPTKLRSFCDFMSLDVANANMSQTFLFWL